MTPRVELDEVQGNVLHAYGKAYGAARYLRFRISDAPGAAVATRSLLRRWTPRVTFGRPPKREAATPPRLNLALTHEGLRELGVPEDSLAGFPEEFCTGARERASTLGDRWQDRVRFVDAHLTLIVHGPDARSCGELAERLRDDVETTGGALDLVQDREAAALPGQGNGPAREHFGFADGASQPAIEGVDTDPIGDGVYSALQPRDGTLRQQTRRLLEDAGIKRPKLEWRLIKAGEFVLGYDNEDGELPAGPPAPLGPNGTFMVYREMPQHVERFEAYLRHAAEELRRGREALGLPAEDLGRLRDELGAKIVGRWKDGTPLSLSSEPDPAISDSRRRENDFLYAEDREGLRCPMGAHIRRTNPRDMLGGGADRTARHRIIRRGMPYGGPEDADKGLVFICFSSSIANGFEFIQREWIDRGTGLGLGDDPDFLLQQPGSDGRLHGQMVVPGYRNVVLDPPDEPFVDVAGCEYLFVPSRRACAWLGELHRS